MTSHTFDNPEEFRGEATLVAEQFSEKLAQLLTHCFRFSSGEKLPDLFDETAALGRELLLMSASQYHHEPAPPIGLIGEHYDKTIEAGRLLLLTLLSDASTNESD